MSYHQEGIEFSLLIQIVKSLYALFAGMSGGGYKFVTHGGQS